LHAAIVDKKRAEWRNGRSGIGFEINYWPQRRCFRGFPPRRQIVGFLVSSLKKRRNGFLLQFLCGWIWFPSQRQTCWFYWAFCGWSGWRESNPRVYYRTN